MKYKIFSILGAFPALVIAAVAGISASSFAMPLLQDSGEQPGERMVRQLDQLHGRLKLTEQQESLWQRAKTESHNKMKSRQAERKQAVKEMKEALNDPQVDLRALSGKMDQRHELAAKESKETRELWLAFYDSLDARQREMARGFLLERIEHMEKAMGNMKHQMMRHRHGSDSEHDMGSHHDMDSPRDQ